MRIIVVRGKNMGDLLNDKGRSTQFNTKEYFKEDDYRRVDMLTYLSEKGIIVNKEVEVRPA